MELIVKGTTCGHCEAAVQRAVKGDPEVRALAEIEMMRSWLAER